MKRFTFVLAITFVLSFLSPLHYAHATTCVTSDITPTLWPTADFPLRFRSDCKAALANVVQPLDQGALSRDSEGCLQILRIGGSDPGFWWERYDPSSFDHYGMASAFHRYGRCWSRGHGHGVDGLALIAYTIWPKLFGRPATLMDEEDTYFRVGSRSLVPNGPGWWVADLLAEYNALTGTQEPPSNPPSGPPIPTPPSNPNCDGKCNGEIDRECKDGMATGRGRCPSDCDAPCETTAPTTPTTPPDLSCVACTADLDNCRTSLSQAESQLRTRTTQVDDLTKQVDNLTAQRDGLQVALTAAKNTKPILPADMSAILRDVCGKWIGTGVSRRGQCNKMRAAVCGLVKCL